MLQSNSAAGTRIATTVPVSVFLAFVGRTTLKIAITVSNLLFIIKLIIIKLLLNRII